MEGEYWGTGRRKTSCARVVLRPGEGKVIVNDQPFEAYFPMPTWRMEVLGPLVATENQTKFNVIINASGGGVHGQAGAARMGIARALLAFQADLKSRLRQGGFLTRDPRAKERKKYGQKGARKRFQFSKR